MYIITTGLSGEKNKISDIIIKVSCFQRFRTRWC